MNYRDALSIAEDLCKAIQPACEPGYAMIGGSLRRRKQDVHDIEIIGMPILKPAGASLRWGYFPDPAG